MSKVSSFKFNKIVFPLIHARVTPESGTDLTHKFRVQLTRISDNQLMVFLGLMVSDATEKENSIENENVVIVESLSEIEIAGDLNDELTLEQITFLPNILATIFPYLREKVTSLFMANEKMVILPPQNMISLVKAISSEIKFEDKRSKIAIGGGELVKP
jgi:hypothetical protein